MAFSSACTPAMLRLILRLILIVLLLGDHALWQPGCSSARAVTRASSSVGLALLVIGQRLIQRRLRLLQIGLGLANLLHPAPALRFRPAAGRPVTRSPMSTMRRWM